MNNTKNKHKDINTEENKLDVSDIYTPLSIAKKEIWRRWNDKDLRKKVEDFLSDIPLILQDEPRAVLARHITSPNLEYLHFLDLASIIDLKPVNLEYLNDKYLSCNPAKFFLGKMCFLEKHDSHEKIHDNHEHIIDFKKAENSKLKEIDTLWGENLVDFHHKILRHNKIDIDMFDISDWYREKGGNARSYMKYYLALFICNGVLFENYLTQKNEKQFTCNVVLPALREVEEMFGLKPLIIPIMPLSSEGDEACGWAYSSHMRENINSYMKK